MPSSKDPLTSVNPGPGKLPAGVVNASAFIIPGGGGGGSNAALLAHINDPVDAHMASAIGVNPTDATTGQLVLSSVGGTVDGESVLDFIVQAKDLFPIRPNRAGFNQTTPFVIPNSGVPNWDTLTTPSVQGGAWTSGAAAVFSHFIWPVGATPPTGFEAFLYPADRGVLAVYFSTDGDFANAGTTSLYGALWLGSTANRPGALTCPSADFSDLLRTTTQPAYTSANVGLDQISLSDRTGYQRDLTAYSYDNFSSDFFAYQLARYVITLPGISAGSNGSYLIVHWRETYVVSDASIASAALAVNFTAANVYSADPTTTSYDAVPTDDPGLSALNRRYIFQDTLSATVPAVASWTATPVGVPSTVLISGVAHYSNGAVDLQWNSDLRVNGLVGNAWLPGKTSGPNLPADFVTTEDPIEFDFTDFGGGKSGRAYYQLRPTGGALYTAAAAPLPGHQVQDLTPVLAITSPTPYTFPGDFGRSRIRVNSNRPWSSDSDAQGDRWIFNSWPQTAPGVAGSSTSTYEPFRDERFRYKLVVLNPTLTVEPTPINKYDSTAVLTSFPGPTADHLQVAGDRLVYPQTDYTIAKPVGQPDYAAVLAGDAANWIRVYFRAFDTGAARSTGKFRIRGLAASFFESTVPFSGNTVADHPNGVVLQAVIPGATSRLDLGRPLGNPVLANNVDGYGCQTSITTVGPDVFVTYDMGAYTADNGSGEYPIFLAVGFINAGAVPLNAFIDEIEWLPA